MIRYVGKKKSCVSIDSRPIEPGQEFTGPPDLLDYLRGRTDFEEVKETKPKKAKKAAR